MSDETRKYLAVYDWESGWYLIGEVRWVYYDHIDYSKSVRGKKVHRAYQPNTAYPVPENVSCFVKAHKIFEADGQEKAREFLLTLQPSQGE